MPVPLCYPAAFPAAYQPVSGKIRLHLLGQPAALLVVGMGVEIGHHTGLGMAGIALHRLDVSAADLQLQ